MKKLLIGLGVAIAVVGCILLTLTFLGFASAVWVLIFGYQ